MRILVSACLLGVKCRYDGATKPCAKVIDYLKDHEVVRMCPEVMGGFSIPHPANEIQTQEPVLKVVDVEGADNTELFEEGARKVVELAQRMGCTHAILKAKSPSCGVGQIYDGTFSDTLVEGDGVAARALREAGLILATEQTYAEVLAQDE